MDAQPLVSIVTPSLNQGRFIGEAIRSVLGQDYPRLEHIVVDGGSTDDTLSVLRRFEHLHWVSEPDDGQADAINKGFRMAHGEIFAWLNADDFYTRGTLDYIRNRFASEPDLHALVGDCDVVDVDGKHLWRLTPGPYDY